MGRTSQPGEEVFAAALRRYRRAAGLTQEDLAERAGLAPLTIRNAERGKHAPQWPNVLALATALGLTPERTPEEFAAFASAWRAQRAEAALSIEAAGEPLHNLPAEVTSFIGREEEVQTLTALLRSPGVRLVTLTGPGGSGKSRLALRAARAVLAAFPDGVWFVPLAQLTDPTLVIPTIARTLGVTEATGASLEERLHSRLAACRTLLLLDNFEHLLAAVPPVTELLRGAPQLRLLVTSRIALQAYGEHERPVPPLPVPAPTASLPALARNPAIMLFRERAIAVRADFVLSAEDAPAVAAICARLDGLPLAIELAAARARRFPPGELLARFPSRLDLGAAGPRDAAARQRTLRATIAWSEVLLPPAERRLFARLAVFAGGWTAEAADVVCRCITEEPAGLAGGLDALEEAALIVRTTSGDGHDRFTMLETIREFAAERLAEDGDEMSIRAGHAAWLLELAGTARHYQPEPPSAAWLARMVAEEDNLRAALAWALAQGEIALAARLAGVFWPIWHDRPHFVEGRRWLNAVLARGDGLPVTLRAPLLTGALALTFSEGDHPRSVALAEEAVVAWAALGDDTGLALVRMFQALTSQNRGDPEGAYRFYQQSLALWQAMGDPPMLTDTLAHLAFMLAQYGRFAEAEQTFEAYRVRAEARGDHNRISRYHIDRGLALMMQGRLGEARTLLKQGIALSRAHGFINNRGMGLIYLGLATLLDGALDEATGYLTEGLALRREAGDKFGVVYSLIGFAGVANKQRRATRAAVLCGAAAALVGSLGAALAPAPRAIYERELAEVRIQLGDAAFAVAWSAGEALSLDDAVDYAFGDEDAV